MSVVLGCHQVLLAAGKGENAVHGHREAEKLLRLFIIVPNHFKDDDVKDHFKVRILSM